MTQALNKAVSELSALSADEQDRIADWLLAELAVERGWDSRFGKSQDALGALADEALADDDLK